MAMLKKQGFLYNIYIYHHLDGSLNIQNGDIQKISKKYWTSNMVYIYILYIYIIYIYIIYIYIISSSSNCQSIFFLGFTVCLRSKGPAAPAAPPWPVGEVLMLNPRPLSPDHRRKHGSIKHAENHGWFWTIKDIIYIYIYMYKLYIYIYIWINNGDDIRWY